MAQEKIVQTAGRTQLGEFAPKFAELNDDVLFGEVWNRTDKLGLRDRSLVTVTSLISQGITDNSLVFHLQSAKKNGITRTEIAEIITHIGFYAGWPKAWAAFNLAKDVWAEDAVGEDAKAAFQREMIFPVGEPNTAYAKYFTGNSYLAPISREQVNISNVTFEPRCRNNWHIHRAKSGGGQMLIGVAGRGWRVNLPWKFSRARLSIFRQTSNTGMELLQTVGLLIWLSRFPVKVLPMNGSNR